MQRCYSIQYTPCLTESVSVSDLINYLDRTGRDKVIKQKHNDRARVRVCPPPPPLHTECVSVCVSKMSQMCHLFPKPVKLILG